MNTYNVNILSNEQICQDTYKMVLYCPDIFLQELLAGQFIHIEIPNAPHLELRRPISIHCSDENSITIIYKVLGVGTKLLSQLKTHDIINILGPIGNGFNIPKDAKKVFLVGGGLGCAPLLSIPKLNCLPDYYTFFGFANQDSIYATDEMELVCEKTFVSTDDGSFGYKGNAVEMMTKFMDQTTPDLILACGPLPMMRAVANIAKEKNIPCKLSLEERMGCGYGSCLTCVCKTNKNGKQHYDRVCVDGPVFNANEVEL